MADTNDGLGAKIKKRRTELRRDQPEKYTGRAFAERLKITPAYLSRIEAGEIVPASDVLVNISKELGLDQAVLFALADKVPPEAKEIINEQPTEVMQFLRTIRGMSRAKMTLAKKLVQTLRDDDKPADGHGAETEKGAATPHAGGDGQNGEGQ